MKPKTVDEYIKNSPKEFQRKLIELRTVIKKAAPHAEEKISYGMPYYGFNGRLVYFRLSKNHIGLYIPPPVIQEFKKELKEYKTAMATIRFSLDKKLPLSLIGKLVRSRSKLNEKAKKRKSTYKKR